MAVSLSHCKFFILTLISIVVFCCTSGNAAVDNPAGIVTRALLCFNNNFIYSSCDEAFRLDQSGFINVPSYGTDQFCNGPCLVETQLVLNCINNIFTNFIFYNKATIHNVRDMLHGGCSFSTQRGNFNVADYIQGETSSAQRLHNPIGFYAFILSCFSLLYHQ